MRRFRLLLLGVCLMLLGPAAFLIQRALHSVELEDEMRQRIVAERVFDEMERALSGLLEREEKQTFDQHRATDPKPEFPFVAGYFQVDPDGAIDTVPAAHAIDPNANAPVEDARQRDTASELERTVSDSWRGNEQAAAIVGSQVPGTTVEVKEGERRGLGYAEPDLRAGKDKVSAFDALRSLNKAVQERAARQQRAAPQAEERDAAAADRLDAPLAQALADSPESAVDLPPFSGRTAGAKRLVLSRSVIHEGRMHRQGVVLDVAQLEIWLRDQGLGSDELAKRAHFSLSTASSPMPGDVAVSAFTYQHRFAEPFSDLTARLDLHALPGSGSVTYVYALSGLLVAATVLGLTTLHQMVSVIVRFAEQRSNFVAAVSHELKTPLTAIRMYAEMLRDGMVLSDEKRNEYYRHMTAESERLSRLINNVLELSRLEKGNREVVLVTGALAPVVREVADMLRPHVEEQGFELQVEIDGDLPAVRFERDALMQVLWNLADNAVKYARDASPRRITLRCRNDGGRVAVSVRDHGPGVAAHHLKRIFDPFYRGENELTRRNKGTGLGLALVRGLTERMGATATGYNVPEGGFEVKVLFRPA